MLYLTIWLLALVGAGHAGINYEECQTYYGGDGDTVECPAYWVAIGLCSSGTTANCGTFFTGLTCCSETVESKEPRVCLSMEGWWGVQLECPANYVVTQVCTSGYDPYCGSAAYTRISCCDDHSLNLVDICNWIYGDYSEYTTCPEGQVIRGVCSSGANPDCNEQGHTGVFCCGFLDK